MLFEDPDLLRLSAPADLPEGEARKVRYERGGRTRELLLCRVRDRYHAVSTLCPHEGGRLAEGPLAEGRFAVCPLHLYRFDPTSGACVGIECDPVRTLHVERSGSDLLIRVSDGDEDDEDETV